MKLADVEMIPGVVVDDEDPKFLGRLKISAPGEKYDPEFDNFKKVKPAKSYNGEEYMADLTDDEAYENDLVKYAGTREERRRRY